MFKKAVNDHPGGTTSKPLQSSLLRTNTAASSKPLPPPQSVGVKRKIEMANSGGSTLGSLHSTVYFDENDFDDDLDLDDLDDPLPFTTPSTTFAKPDPVNYPKIHSATTADNKLPANVAYPDLPPASQEPDVPSSSIQIPWSSSPPSHFQPPQKPRTLPWLQGGKKEDTKNSLITPKRTKPTDIWNKSASAIKEEQKELRREYKKTQKETLQDLAASTLSSKNTKILPVQLSEEQLAVLEAVVDRKKSIFFTGSAGTGKSVLMREIIKKLRLKYKNEPDRVAVTASTGLAACNIGGVTLHSFAGIGLGKEAVPELVKKVKKNQKARNRWLRTKVLIVDEVSMVDGDLFDKLEEIARRIRNNGRPFGGIQLVVTGDFFQLPPVPERNREAKFSFAAATWNTTIQHTILLTHVFRQRDPEFAAMLNELRLGNPSASTVDAFRRLSRPLNFHDELDATELFPTRNEVENANSARMSRLSGEMMSFTAVDSGTVTDPQYREKLLSNCMAPPVIHLKKGAQVMLIKNMEETLVNGSIGRVVAFMDEASFDYYRTNEDDFHPTGEGDVSDEDSAARARKKLKGMTHKEGPATITRKWPLVCFVQPDGTERHLLCQPEAWKIELPNGEVQAQRSQVPLILAWALSIHKAQGQTLQRVKVDLGRVFEKGQAYVALSRATSQAGLQVTGFEARKVMVHHKVTEFYNNLVSISQVLGPKAKKANASKAAEGGDDDCFIV
ncbi:ATP-dependent DNA helicase PIF1 [Penicillium odoratum]|uniref:ATP-dependent DNA helicase PIF1 n=1 Tax=Penicillium odoratum TaxID=1167516 RepID=UPI002546A2EF|nr:ATP-dependent DNA helicase PIF1 [Penicillium odoratum]KAJ5745876.1 ATP-dependent DNA helicase PIF1 [Penicillium odoratum]